jgi:DNA-binding transcriptional LysR family regulator
MIDLQNLHAFITVARYGSFSAAAKHLHITQPAVSKRIKSIEEQLDVRLFDRVHKNLSLTPAGQSLLGKAETIYQASTDMQRHASNLKSMVTGELSIATSHHIGLHRLPPILKQFRQQYPAVTLDLHFVDSEQASHGIEKGDYELAIVTLADSLPEKISSQLLWQDPLSIVVANDHILTTKRQPSVAEIADHPSVLPEVNTYTYNILSTALSERLLSAKVAIHTNYLETIKMLIIAGYGWSIFPPTKLDDRLTILTTELHLCRHLGVINHSERTLSNAGQALLNLLQNHADMLFSK